MLPFLIAYWLLCHAVMKTGETMEENLEVMRTEACNAWLSGSLSWRGSRIKVNSAGDKALHWLTEGVPVLKSKNHNFLVYYRLYCKIYNKEKKKRTTQISRLVLSCHSGHLAVSLCMREKQHELGDGCLRFRLLSLFGFPV